MDNKIKSEKYRKFPVVSLVTGIIALVSTPFTFIIMSLFDFMSAKGEDQIYLYGLNSIGFILGIVAIILGSLDLVKIRAGKYDKNDRGMDIGGIVSGIIAVIITVFLFYDIFGLVN